MAILDQFGRIAPQPIDGISNPRGIRQTSTLPKTVSVLPVAIKPAPPVTTVPAYQPGNLYSDPGTRVDPIIPSVGLVKYNAPATSVTAPAPGSSGTGGCLLCNASGTPPVALASVAGGSEGGSAVTSPAALLSATTGEVPWWLLVLGGALAGVLVRKMNL